MKFKGQQDLQNYQVKNLAIEIVDSLPIPSGYQSSMAGRIVNLSTDNYAEYVCDPVIGWRKLVSGADSENWVVTNYIARAKLLDSSDAEATTQSSTYVMLKELDSTYYGHLESLYVQFDLRSGGSYEVRARIYKNGIQVGTTRSTSSTSYTTFSETITGVSAGDLIQLYVTSRGVSWLNWYQARVRNFRVYNELPVTERALKPLIVWTT